MDTKEDQVFSGTANEDVRLEDLGYEQGKLSNPDCCGFAN